MSKAKKSRSHGLAWPIAGVAAGALVLWSGLEWRAEDRIDPTIRQSDSVYVQIPPAHRVYVADWPRFFACYGFEDKQVILATLRDNGFPAFPGTGDVRVLLRSSRALEATPEEEKVVAEMNALIERPGGCPQ